MNGKKMARVAGFMMFATLIARLLGLLRDMVFYTWFGRTHITDAYNAAFSVPDLIYLLLVGGALSSAFIPVFSSYLAREQEEEAWKAASIVLNYTIMAMLALIFIGEIYTRPLVLLLVPNLPVEEINLTVLLTRVMFIQTFFMALNGIAMGVLNSKQHFTWPAIGSILYNVGIIAVGLAMARVWGIMAFSIGVVVGSIINFLVQVPALLRAGIKYYPSLNYRHPGFRQIITLMIPVAVGLSVTQINLFITQNLASGLAEGSISALRLAQRIMQLPIGIFGTSIALAVFPTMNFQAAREEIRDLKRTFSLGVRAIFLITIPAGVGLIALREPIIQLFFQQGKFTAADTASTAWALLFYSLGLFAYSALQLLNRVFYSLKDTLTPVIVGIVSIGLNILFSILMVGPMQDRGLALAYSAAGILNMLILIVLLKWRLQSIDGFKMIKSFVISTAASGVMYAAVRFLVNVLQTLLPLAGKAQELIVVAGGVGAGVLVYGVIVLLFRLEESQLVWGMIKSRIPGLNFPG